MTSPGGTRMAYMLTGCVAVIAALVEKIRYKTTTSNPEQICYLFFFPGSKNGTAVLLQNFGR